MRVLLDENLPVQLADRLMEQHEARHVTHLGWKGLPNSELLHRAVAEGFDVLLTGDTHMADQQDLTQFNLAVVQIRVRRRVIKELLAILPAVLEAIHTAPKSELTTVSSDDH